MKNKVKVSVIIPTYNHAEFLERAIKSVLDQTFQDFEIIVVDDGSTDNTKAVVNKLKNQDYKIKYICQKNSGGPSSPKNRGIKSSKGEYIAFLDSDDEWFPDKLEKQIKLFKQADASCGLVTCNAIIIDKDGNELAKYKTPKYKEPLKELLKLDYIFSNSSIILSRRVINKVGYYDEKLKTREDWEMWIRILNFGFSFNFTEEFLFKYRVHNKNISKEINFSKKNIEYYEYIFQKYKNLYKRYNICGIILEKLGIRMLLNNNPLRARKYFLKKIKINKLNLGTYLLYFLTFTGSLGSVVITYMYKFVVYIKNKYKKDKTAEVLQKYLQ
ncbi:MAG: glycosyltransferase [Patescibacteria group bacterium]